MAGFNGCTDAGNVKKTDIVNNLTSMATDKPLSANMGKFLSDHFGNTLWSGSAFTSGSITVPNLDDYYLFLFYFSDTTSILVTRGANASASIMWGGLSYEQYNSDSIITISCRYNHPSGTNLTIDSNNRGFTDGTSSNYSGNTTGLIRIVGLV